MLSGRRCKTLRKTVVMPPVPRPVRSRSARQRRALRSALAELRASPASLAQYQFRTKAPPCWFICRKMAWFYERSCCVLPSDSVVPTFFHPFRTREGCRFPTVSARRLSISAVYYLAGGFAAQSRRPVAGVPVPSICFGFRSRVSAQSLALPVYRNQPENLLQTNYITSATLRFLKFRFRVLLFSLNLTRFIGNNTVRSSTIDYALRIIHRHHVTGCQHATAAPATRLAGHHPSPAPVAVAEPRRAASVPRWRRRDDRRAGWAGSATSASTRSPSR